MVLQLQQCNWKESRPNEKGVGCGGQSGREIHFACVLFFGMIHSQWINDSEENDRTTESSSRLNIRWSKIRFHLTISNIEISQYIVYFRWLWHCHYTFSLLLIELFAFIPYVDGYMPLIACDGSISFRLKLKAATFIGEKSKDYQIRCQLWNSYSLDVVF